MMLTTMYMENTLSGAVHFWCTNYQKLTTKLQVQTVDVDREAAMQYLLLVNENLSISYGDITLLNTKLLQVSDAESTGVLSFIHYAGGMTHWCS